MIAFRDETARRLGLDLIVHVNEDGLRRGINPIASGSALHTQVMKTEALKQALDQHGFDAAFGGARRDEEKSRAKERIFSLPHREPRLGPAQPAAGALEPLQHPHPAGRDRSASSRSRTGPSSTCGTTCWPRASPWCRSTSPSSGRWCAAPAPGSWSTTTACRSRRASGRRCARCASARSAATRCPARSRSTADTLEDDRGRDARRPHLRAPGPPDRLRRGRLDGEEEARGLFLMNAFDRAPGTPRRQAAARGDKSLLRFLTCGSVDDGKSTLIGRLLSRARLIPEDQLRAARDATAASTAPPGEDIDLALLVDGLEAERAAGHHHRRRLPLLRHAAPLASSSPTRRATSSTRATWRPAPRTPTSPSC